MKPSKQKSNKRESLQIAGYDPSLERVRKKVTL